MASETAYNMLLTDLGYLAKNMTTDQQALLQGKLATAAAELAAAGIVIDETQLQDLDLLSMYAAWLWRSRVQQQAQPLMLQRLLRNRQASQIAGGST